MTATCDDVRDLAAGFVLGALTPAEDVAVRDHIATCAEPHAELAELGGVVPYLAASLEPVEPSVGLRERLLAAAAAEPRGEAGASPSGTAAITSLSGAEARGEAATLGSATVARLATPASESVDVARETDASPAPAATIPFPSAPERVARAERTSAARTGASPWLLRIAAVVAIAVLGAWNLQLQSRLGTVEGDLVTARAYQDAVASALAIASQPGGQTAFMSGADPSVTASGVAAVSTQGELVLAMRGLKPTTGAQVYEAWVIVGDAAPVPIGGFQVGPAGTGTFTATTDLAEPGVIVALTLESAPNATAPTLPVLSVGSLATGSG